VCWAEARTTPYESLARYRPSTCTSTSYSCTRSYGRMALRPVLSSGPTIHARMHAAAPPRLASRATRHRAARSRPTSIAGRRTLCEYARLDRGRDGRE
jgi:hypothetical protein